MTYDEWEEGVHARVKSEPVWGLTAYRKALFLYDLAWQDCDALRRDHRGRGVSERLIRSCGSVSANVEEGHGRGYGKQRNWFLGVAIGSARETKGWYWRAKELLSEQVLDHRLSFVDGVISLLVTELHRQQSR